MIEHHSHPTADEIYKALEHRFPNMSVATVYNNLRLFTSIGFVQEMKYGDASSRFDFSSKRHYHVICENCGKIVDFHYPGLEDIEMAASRLTDFEINEHRLNCMDFVQTVKNQQKGTNVKQFLQVLHLKKLAA